MINPKRWKEKEKVLAINDKDLKKLLIERKIFVSEKESNLSCIICKNKIQFDEISAIKLVKGKVHLFCQNVNCLKRAGEANNE